MENLIKSVFETPEELLEALDIAKMESRLSMCQRKKVGSALVYREEGMDVSLIYTGYGGAKGFCEECIRDKEEWRQDGCWSVHSELQAIFRAMDSWREGPSLSRRKFTNSVMVVTHGPCDQCLKYMHYLGIPVCVYEVPYHDNWKKWSGKIDVVSYAEILEVNPWEQLKTT